MHMHTKSLQTVFVCQVKASAPFVAHIGDLHTFALVLSHTLHFEGKRRFYSEMALFAIANNGQKREK